MDITSFSRGRTLVICSDRFREALTAIRDDLQCDFHMCFQPQEEESNQFPSLNDYEQIIIEEGYSQKLADRILRQNPSATIVFIHNTSAVNDTPSLYFEGQFYNITRIIESDSIEVKSIGIKLSRKEQKLVFRNGKAISLTPSEFRILYAMMSNYGDWVEYSIFGLIGETSIHTHMNSIRNKIKAIGESIPITCQMKHCRIDNDSIECGKPDA